MSPNTAYEICPLKININVLSLSRSSMWLLSKKYIYQNVFILSPDLRCPAYCLRSVSSILNFAHTYVSKSEVLEVLAKIVLLGT